MASYPTAATVVTVVSVAGGAVVPLLAGVVVAVVLGATVVAEVSVVSVVPPQPAAIAITLNNTNVMIPNCFHRVRLLIDPS
jgi:hypothetical protein